MPRPPLAVISGGSAIPLALRTDDQLMLSAADGSAAAFEVLVRRHQARVLRVAARYLGDTSLAGDVAQNAFLELYRVRHRYEPRGQFVAFLFKIALNQCRMAARAASAGRRTRLELWRADPTAVKPAPYEDRRDLQRALNQLSDKLRAVVICRYGADLDLNEIAETLDLPLGTVKRRLFDAMAKLRDLLEREE